MALMSVEDARRAVIAAAALMPTESVSINEALHRALARPLRALRSQPPTDVSAMDGYAVRHQDLAAGAVFKLVGESAAGHVFCGTLAAGETVRIFTGAPVPDGADTVLLQENVERSGEVVTALQSEPLGRHIRRKGLDFTLGDERLTTGQPLSERSLALAAAMGHGHIKVRRKPRIGILATGDELVLPGAFPAENLQPHQIIASNHLTTAAIVSAAGGEAIQLGIAGDSMEALEQALLHAKSLSLDVLVTLGAASVGDRDLVQSALAKQGLALSFWKIAMRPGKPMMFGQLGDLRILGLPGNPVSSFVCAKLFLAPLIRAMMGDPQADADASEPGILGTNLSENDQRMDFLRAKSDRSGAQSVITPFAVQDSSMISTMAAADALLIRAPHAPAARAGDPCRFLRL